MSVGLGHPHNHDEVKEILDQVQHHRKNHGNKKPKQEKTFNTLYILIIIQITVSIFATLFPTWHSEKMFASYMRYDILSKDVDNATQKTKEIYAGLTGLSTYFYKVEKICKNSSLPPKQKSQELEALSDKFPDILEAALINYGNIELIFNENVQQNLSKIYEKVRDSSNYIENCSNKIISSNEIRNEKHNLENEINKIIKKKQEKLNQTIP